MGSSGNITTFLDFHDSVNSEPLNQRFIGRFPLGIYYGADLGIVSNTTVSVSAFDIEIGDGTTRLKATSSGSNNVTVSTSNVWVVFRWSYTGTANDVPSLLGVSSVATNDLIIGKCVYAGSTLSGFDLTLKTDASTFNKFCLVEPTGTASMQLKVRGGRVSNNLQTYFIAEQITSAITAPVSNPRIDVIAVNSSGAIIIITGTENVTPVAPSYANNIPLAQVTLQTSTTSITSTLITDARPFLVFTSSSVPAGAFFPFGGSSAPSGFLLCDGTAYSRTTYSTLFIAIGIAYGAGDGTTTFNVPNMQSSVPAGLNASDTSFNSLGKAGGESTHLLTSGESGLPAHTHTTTFTGNLTAGSNVDAIFPGGGPHGPFVFTSSTAGPANASSAHNNLQPYLTCNYIIKY